MTPTSDTRPNPDSLLAAASQEGRGRLKIFLGAAPGVGKTYAMLSGAKRLIHARVDVVVGVVETHGRMETEALLEGLELLPRRTVAYRGTALSEFDLDAALARRPALLVVDELAHTNAEESRHPKRYLDVEELLAAGIDVWTAVNIQHLESLSDVVSRITGVLVRETVPDTIVDRADEVVVVDVTPAELITRLSEGRIYLPENARRAAAGFFKSGNLTALRELALRRTADRVDDQMVDHLRQNAIEGAWPTSERILVCVGSDVSSDRVVRAASRLASGLNAPWIAVTLERPGFEVTDVAALQRTDDAMRLAERLGAEIGAALGARPARRDHALRPAGERHPDRHRPIEPVLLGAGPGSVPVRHAVATGVRHRGACGGRRRPRTPASPWRWPARNGLAIGLAAATMLGRNGGAGRHPGHALPGPARPLDDLPRRGPRLCRDGGTMAGDRGRDPVLPRLQLLLHPAGLHLLDRDAARASRPHHLRARGHRHGRARRQGAGPVQRRPRQGEDDPVALRRIAEAVGHRQHRGRPLGRGPPGRRRHQRASGRPAAGKRWAREGRADDQGRVSAGGHAPARRVGGRAMGVRAVRSRPGGAPAPCPNAHFQFQPVRTSSGIIGVVGLAPTDRSRPLSAEEERALAALIDQGALAIERATLVVEARRGEAVAERERLQTTLLSSISHDLRTPLAAILGSATSLREYGGRMDQADRDDLVLTIEEEARRLTRFVTNLLDMTRVESGSLDVRRDYIDLSDVLLAAVKRAGRSFPDRVVDVRVQPGAALVQGDAVLLEQAIFNLLDNADKYTAPGSPTVLRAEESGTRMLVTVEDEGCGIPSDAFDRVFEKFTRLSPGDGRPAGTGLGLAIAKGVVEAMGGSIRAESPVRSGRGTRIVVDLPAAKSGATLASTAEQEPALASLAQYPARP